MKKVIILLFVLLCFLMFPLISFAEKPDIGSAFIGYNKSINIPSTHAFNVLPGPKIAVFNYRIFDELPQIAVILTIKKNQIENSKKKKYIPDLANWV